MAGRKVTAFDVVSDCVVGEKREHLVRALFARCPFGETAGPVVFR